MGLKEWLHALHQVTGSMALHWMDARRFYKDWAKALRKVAKEMDEAARKKK